MGGCGASNRYSWLAAAGCFAGTVEGLSYSHVLATSKSAPEAKASREANFGTASHVLAASASSLSRAAMPAKTRVANHGLAISVAEPTPLKISRVARRSCAASRHFSQEARWARSAGDKTSLNVSTLAAAGRTAAASSIESCNFVHSSSLVFSRFHIPASLPLLPSQSISALLGQADHPTPRPEESNLDRVPIQTQNFSNLLDGKPFHFFQYQHQPVPLIQSFQQALHVLPGFEPLADIRPRVLFVPGCDHLPGLFLAQIGLVHQGPHFLLPQQVPTFIHRDLIQPGAECRSLVKFLQREIRFNENLLRDIFHVLAPSQYSSCYGKHPVLVPPDKLLKRFLVLSLRLSNQFAVRRCADRLGSMPPCGSRSRGRVERLHFWDACHRDLVTPNVSGLPGTASYSAIHYRSLFACFPSYRHVTIPA